MKKKSLILFPLLFLMGCSQSEIASSEFSLTYENNVPVIHRDASGNITYLMMSRYGRIYYNEQLVAGGNIEEKYYENCFKYEAAAGSALPEAVFYKDGEVKEDVEFRGWYVYTNKVYPEKVTSVPTAIETTVYAIFDGPTGGSGGVITEGYGIKFTDGTKVLATKLGETDHQGREQYLISNYSFTAGKAFALYDFAENKTWTIDLDPYSFGGTDAAPTWSQYLSKSTESYTVLKSFTADVYIKLKYQDDQIYIGLK